MGTLAIFIALLLNALGLVPASAQQQQQLLHQERSLYRNIFVVQTGDERCMLFRFPRRGGRQSCRLMHDPDKFVFSVSQLMLSGLYLNPNPKRILMIGEGGGTVVTALQNMLPDTR